MASERAQAAAQAAAGEDQAAGGERSWLVVLVLSRAFVTLIFMTYAASLPTLSREWAMSATQAGLVQTAFSAGFAVSLFATSWLADHVGARRMFFWFCWLGAAAALAFALFARSFEQALWLYGLVGFTQGGSYTPAIMLVAQRLPPARRGAAVGWVLAGMSAGYVGSISLTQGLIATFGYRAALLACALGTVAGAVFGSIAAARAANRTAGRTPPAGHVAMLTDRRSLLLTVGYVGHCWELFGMWAWAPAFLLASLGDRFTLGAVGLGIAIAMALHLSAFFASFTLGQASDRYGRRAVLLAVAAVGALCSFGFGWSGALPPLLLLSFATLYGFAALGDSSVLSTAMSEAVPPAYLGRALAIRSILGIGVGAAAPAAFGAILDVSAPGHGWGWAFALMAVGGVIASLCAALLPDDAPPRAAPPPAGRAAQARR
ncbi:MAG TPA: MFS transporter [Geminicoccaceae bacterium]|nr:MFS transporter [Geminicoccaceae bacterium]